MQFHQKSWRNLFLAESGVREKGAKSSDSLPSKEEPDFLGHPHEKGMGVEWRSPQRLQPLSLTNRIHHSHPDSVPSPLPSHHTHGGGGQHEGWHWSFTDISTPKELEVPLLWAVLYTPGLEGENISGLAFSSLPLCQFHQTTVPYPFPWQLPPRRLKLLFGSQRAALPHRIPGSRTEHQLLKNSSGHRAFGSPSVSLGKHSEIRQSEAVWTRALLWGAATLSFSPSTAGGLAELGQDPAPQPSCFTESQNHRITEAGKDPWDH